MKNIAPKGDTTSARRQKRLREKGKVWLGKHGFTSWESLRTKLMRGEYILIKKGNGTK